MSSEASHHIENFGKVLAYTVYHLGVGILIGLVRTIVAVAYIAKHTFYAKAYEEASRARNQQERDKLLESHKGRDHEIRAAEKKTQQAQGFQKLGAFVKETVVKARHTAGAVKDEVVFGFNDAVQDIGNTAVQEIQEARRAEWYGQMVRGLSEIFYIGAPYYTYQDNFSKEHKASVFGIKELGELIKNEQDFDHMIQSLIGKDLYDPLF